MNDPIDITWVRVKLSIRSGRMQRYMGYRQAVRGRLGQFLVGLLFLQQMLITDPVQAEPNVAAPTTARNPKRYPYFFPLLADRATARGAQLQLPWGIGVNYLYMNQQINISKIALSVNDNPTQEVDFIGFKRVRSEAHTFTLRPDLWVFPFLNVYGIFGGAAASTKVEVDKPVAFTTVVNQGATTAGFGLTTIVGFYGLFASLDANFTWTNLEKLLEPLPGTIVSVRLGKNYQLSQGRSFTFWGGAMYQAIRATTKGSIALDEALGQDTIDDINDAADQLCENSGRPALCNKFLEDLRERSPADTVVNYHLDKEIKYPVNMLVGGQYGFSRNWFVRGEVGFLGRFSALVSANYRFGIPVR